jgi:hypothetical protein
MLLSVTSETRQPTIFHWLESQPSLPAPLKKVAKKYRIVR